ncbi:MAG: HAMP domain-containing protein [Rubrivivax sp.]|nr:HAMP domain-containing protein [Rubrivivax sp.]
MFSRLSIAGRLWAPTLFLAAMLLLAGSVTTVRTQALIAQSAQVQEAQQDKLEAALQWRNAAAHHEPADALERRLRAHTASADEQAALARVAAATGPARADALDALVTLQRDQARRMREAAAAERMRTVWGVLALMVVIVSISALGSAFLVRTVRRPLQDLRNLAERIGHGDLAVPVDTTRADEIGDLQRSIAEMRDALRSVVGDVQASAEQIRVASSEVAMGNNDLSTRTESTASRLQQTASAMAQITTTVQQSGDAASRARALAEGAQAVAQRGGTAVGEVVSTMTQIQASSRKIADIVGTIDGIAFQTNILALNAAVEAARAGEQGRGFAVVASEVRGLAQRSAAAAREIKTLIGQSVETVEAGAQRVQGAGATMAEIVGSVQAVSALVADIAGTAGQQSGDIGRVNAAVTELDHLTQQNAALVEQSAAAAESLKDQAQRLGGAVGRFRLA